MGRPRKTPPKTNFQPEQLNRAANTRCFAYRKSSLSPAFDDCRCLTDLYCRNGNKCRFYKPINMTEENLRSSEEREGDE